MEISSTATAGSNDEPPVGEPIFAKWFVKLEHLASLSPDWDGGRTASPNASAIANATQFLRELQRANLPPNAVAASVVGGIGITLRKHGRKLCTEFQNKGTILALFSDGKTAPQATRIVPEDYRSLIERARVYLDEQHPA
jgi:hypothetical protein